MIAPIVAGTDGSEESLAATAWAAVEAMRRHVPLCIVHVVDHDRGSYAHAHVAVHDLAGRFHHELPHHARAVLAKAAHRAALAAPGIDLHSVTVHGQAGQVLTAITARVPLLAVGTRGTSGVPGLRVGPVALHLARCAKCPVVFARADSSPVSSEILVGTEGSDDAAAGLEFGFGEADTRHARLTAVRISALPHTARLEGYPNWILSVGPLDAGGAALLANQVAPWRHKYPDVLVTEAAVHGQPGRVLTMFSAHAGLVVVAGDRVRPGVPPGSGSVADALLHHAQCPVAVIPGSLGTVTEADQGVLLSA